MTGFEIKHSWLQILAPPNMGGPVLNGIIFLSQFPPLHGEVNKMA